MRVVLDTNILISAFVFPGGSPESVFRLALEERMEIVTSPALLAEFARVLTDKFEWESAMVEQAVAQVARVAAVVRPSESVEMIAEDPDDDRVLEAAAEGSVEAIVSGDRHLLKLRTWRGVRIQRAGTFLASFEHTD